MSYNREKLKSIQLQIQSILLKVKELETEYMESISLVHPRFQKSALNLVHYLAFRSFDVYGLQQELRDFGLPSLSNIEAHVMKSLLLLKTIVNHLLGDPVFENRRGIVSVKNSEKILRQNTKSLFGSKSKKRRTRIMVTMPNSAADNEKFIHKLIDSGMNIARINCAHDNKVIWAKMIMNIKNSSKKPLKNCKIMMDISGPKLRTGSMIEGPQIIRLKPQTDDMGKIIKPAKVWIAPSDILPPDNSADAIIPVDEDWFCKIKDGNTITFKDIRGQECELLIYRSQAGGKWALCKHSAYLQAGTKLILHKQKISGEETIRVGSLLPLKQVIVLKIGDELVLHKDSIPGENIKYDEKGNVIKKAHISCTFSEIFQYIKKNEPVFFDDGKIEGIVKEVTDAYLLIKITYAKNNGSKLKADNGINFPDSELKIKGLTKKDKEDLKFVVKNADAVNLSFVNDENDIQELLDELNLLEAKIGVILKIETKKGFKNLPKILLRAMQTYPLGVMIARGDLAIEMGWKDFASIQEEILRICEAAHIPNIWATQVLENLIKKGIPSRAEITDVAMAQRAECVMLNKGYYIIKGLKMLDRMLRRVQNFQKKRETILPKLVNIESLTLSHDEYSVD